MKQETPTLGAVPPPPPADADPGSWNDYWFGLIPESEAAEFRHVTVRKMQIDRQKGNGPKFIRISARCIRYRRIDLHEHSETLVRASTADPGPDPCSGVAV